MTSAQIELLHEIDKSISVNLSRAIMALREGKPILLLDDSARENEGDLVIAAEKITSESMNFLIKKGSGVVCLAMPKKKLDELGLAMMIPDNTNFFKTAFTVSIEASCGVTTGVSAKDRAHTITVAIDDDAKASDLARPGHVFPLAAKQNGVFERMGHTEGSVDLMKIAKLRAGAVLSELMNDDGTMTVGEERIKFADQLNIPIVSVEEILFHRIKTENIFEKTQTKNINTRFGHLSWHRFKFFGSINIDIFHKQSFNKNDNKPAKISLSVDNNLANRLLAQALNQSSDDSLVEGLNKLENSHCDLVIMASSESHFHDEADKQKKTFASICRVLNELQIKNIDFMGLNSEILQIAKNHFTFDKIN